MNTTTTMRLAALLAFALAPALALAQGEKTGKADPETNSGNKVVSTLPAAPRQAPQAYTLAISVKESDGGKDAVVKNYALTVLTDDGRFGYDSLRDGDRVPYMGEKGRDYHNVGTNLDVRGATRLGDLLVISLIASDSSLAAKSDGVNLPFEHDWNVQLTAVLTPGVPAVVYSAEDAVSGHKVEIHATAQAMK